MIEVAGGILLAIGVLAGVGALWSVLTWDQI